MCKSRLHEVIAWGILGWGTLLASSLLPAAELRTTSGLKPVVRHASFQQSEDGPSLPVPDAPAMPDEFEPTSDAPPARPPRIRAENPGRSLLVPRSTPRPLPLRDQVAIESEAADELVVDEGVEPELLPSDCDCAEWPGGNCLGCCFSGWASGEFMLAWRANRFMPPLVTGAPDGVLPTAPILFGNGDIGSGPESSFRVSGGVWWDACQTLGTGVRFLWLGEQEVTYHAESTGATGTQVLARPFIDSTNQLFDALIVAGPNGGTNGIIDIRSASNVSSGDLLVRKRLWTDCCSRSQIEFLCGYQFSRIHEDLQIEHSFVAAAGNPQGIQAGTTVGSFDLFDAKNWYHAGTFGLLGQFYCNCWRFDALAKFALGGMYQVMDIRGATNIGGSERVGGLLAQETNIGKHTHGEFAYSQEINLGVTYQLTPCVDLSVGYALLYWSDVIQPGNQVDLQVDGRFLNQTRPIPGPAPTRPALTLRESDYWVHGVTVGGTWRF